MQRIPHRSVRSLAAGATRAAVLAVAVAWVLWLIAAQALLWTPLLRSLLNAHSPRIHLEYASAWSVWPGTVHARGLVLTGQDHGVEWRLGLDEVRATIAIGQLPARLFHATQVRARGIRFALRRRAFLRVDAPADVRGLPWIDGFGPIPFKEEGPDDDLPDSRYRLFSVWLEGIEGKDVRQIWIDRWRVEGAAEVAGAFYLKPVRQVLVAPGELRLHGATVSMAASRVADDVQGILRVSLGAFDPRGLTMERFFRTVDVDAGLRGHLAGIEVLGGKGGKGPAEVLAKVRRGRVEQATVSANSGAAALHGMTAGSAALRATVGDGARARVDVAAPRFREASVRAARVRVDLSAEPPDFAALNPAAVAAFDVSGGRIDDARVLGRRLFRSRRVHAGKGSFAAHLEGPLHRLRGTARVSLRRLAISRPRRERPRRCAGGRAHRGPRSLALCRSLRHPGFGGRRRAWFPTRRSVRAGGRAPCCPARASASTRCGSMRTSRRAAGTRAPIVGVYAHLKDLPGFLNSLFGMDGLSVRGSAHAGADWLFLPEVTAEGADGASVRATLRENAHSQRGAALLTVHGISVALDLNGGRSSLHLFGPGDFFADRQREVREKPLARRAPARRR